MSKYQKGSYEWRYFDELVKYGPSKKETAMRRKSATSHKTYSSSAKALAGFTLLWMGLGFIMVFFQPIVGIIMLVMAFGGLLRHSDIWTRLD